MLNIKAFSISFIILSKYLRKLTFLCLDGIWRMKLKNFHRIMQAEFRLVHEARSFSPVKIIISHTFSYLGFAKNYKTTLSRCYHLQKIKRYGIHKNFNLYIPIFYIHQFQFKKKRNRNSEFVIQISQDPKQEQKTKWMCTSKVRFLFELIIRTQISFQTISSVKSLLDRNGYSVYLSYWVF